MRSDEGNPTSEREGVAAALASLNAAWLERRYDDLEKLLDERVVMALPGFTGRVEGRSSMVAGFREFVERATVTRFDASEPVIDVWGDAAVASFHWDMEWKTSAATERASGHDVFMFRHVADGWRAIWRTMSIDSETKEV